jgi:hypothetical protein
MANNYGGAVLALVLVPGFWAALPVVLVAGMGWTTYLSTLMSEVQVFLPNWIRARALALLMVSFTAAQVLGSVVWGSLAEVTGLRTSWLAAAGLILASAVLAALWRLPDLGARRSEPIDFWGSPKLVFTPDPDTGPVVITVEYTISPDRLDRFESLLPRLRQSRLQTGAMRWDLYRSGERRHLPRGVRGRVLGEHEKQHHRRAAHRGRPGGRATGRPAVRPATHGRNLIPPPRTVRPRPRLAGGGDRWRALRLQAVP